MDDDNNISCEPSLLCLGALVLIVIGVACEYPIFVLFGVIIITIVILIFLIVFLITCCGELIFNIEDWFIRRRIRRMVVQRRHKITVSTVEKLDQDTLCTICQDNIPKGKKGKRLGCQHAFHSKCIDKWLEENDTCPNCRYISVEIV